MCRIAGRSHKEKGLEMTERYPQENRAFSEVNERQQAYGQDEFSYEIKEHLGVLSTSNTGWTKELNIISFCGRPPRYDIREWSKNHDKMSRGIGLSEQEASIICGLLKKRGLGESGEERAAAPAAAAAGDDTPF